MNKLNQRPRILTLGLPKSVFYLIVLVVVFYSPALELIFKETKNFWIKFEASQAQAKKAKLLTNSIWPFEQNLKFLNGTINLNVKIKPLDDLTLGYIIKIDPVYPTPANLSGLWFNFNLRDDDGFLIKDFKIYENQMVNTLDENKVRVGALIEGEIILEIVSATKVASIDFTYGGDPNRIKEYEHLSDSSPSEILAFLENEKREQEKLAEQLRLAEIEKQKEEEKKQLAETERLLKIADERLRREQEKQKRIAEEKRAKELAIQESRREAEEAKQNALKQKAKEQENLKIKWSEIVIGLSMIQVKSILGQPDNITSGGGTNLGFAVTDSYATYYYGGYLGGKVDFVNGRVTGYSKPFKY